MWSKKGEIMKHSHHSLTTSTVEMSIQKPTKQSTKKNESVTRNIDSATIRKNAKVDVQLHALYTAQIQCRGEWWIGWIREVSGVTCQERTRGELLETLKITLIEVLEYDSQEAVRQAESEYEIVKIAV